MPDIECFFDCSSPWTYFAFHNLLLMQKELGIDIAWRPILVGGVFNAVNPSVHNSREKPVPAKSAYGKKDQQDWARHLGIRMHYRPTVFPVNSVRAMRGCILLEPEGKLVPFALATFEAYWGDDKDISQVPVLREICEKVGVDADTFLAGIEQQADQGQAARHHAGADRSRRLRLAHHVRRRRRHVFRQRPHAADPRGGAATPSRMSRWRGFVAYPCVRQPIVRASLAFAGYRAWSAAEPTTNFNGEGVRRR